MNTGLVGKSAGFGIVFSLAIITLVFSLTIGCIQGLKHTKDRCYRQSLKQKARENARYALSKALSELTYHLNIESTDTATTLDKRTNWLKVYKRSIKDSLQPITWLVSTPSDSSISNFRKTYYIESNPSSNCEQLIKLVSNKIPLTSPISPMDFENMPNQKFQAVYAPRVRIQEKNLSKLNTRLNNFYAYWIGDESLKIPSTPEISNLDLTTTSDCDAAESGAHTSLQNKNSIYYMPTLDTSSDLGSTVFLNPLTGRLKHNLKDLLDLEINWSKKANTSHPSFTNALTHHTELPPETEGIKPLNNFLNIYKTLLEHSENSKQTLKPQSIKPISDSNSNSSESKLLEHVALNPCISQLQIGWFPTSITINNYQQFGLHILVSLYNPYDYAFDETDYIVEYTVQGPKQSPSEIKLYTAHIDGNDTHNKPSTPIRIFRGLLRTQLGPKECKHFQLMIVPKDPKATKDVDTINFKEVTEINYDSLINQINPYIQPQLKDQTLEIGKILNKTIRSVTKNSEDHIRLYLADSEDPSKISGMCQEIVCRNHANDKGNIEFQDSTFVSLQFRLRIIDTIHKNQKPNLTRKDFNTLSSIIEIELDSSGKFINNLSSKSGLNRSLLERSLLGNSDCIAGIHQMFNNLTSKFESSEEAFSNINLFGSISLGNNESILMTQLECLDQQGLAYFCKFPFSPYIYNPMPMLGGSRLPMHLKTNPHTINIGGADTKYMDISYYLNSFLWDSYYWPRNYSSQMNASSEIYDRYFPYLLYSNKRFNRAHFSKEQFNVNTTHINAWKQLLRKYFPKDISTLKDVSEKTYKRILEAYAKAITDAVKNRLQAQGPFFTLGAFINRNLKVEDNKQNGDLATSILEQAILKANKELNSKNTNLTLLNQKCNFYLKNHPVLILEKMYDILVSKGDTFWIRSYGEAQDKYQKHLVAKAYCEALVQRVPMDNNQFRFKIIGFRRLSEAEI